MSLKSVGQRIRQVIEELGPTFIKMEQIASTRPDVAESKLNINLLRGTKHRLKKLCLVLRGKSQKMWNNNVS